MLDFSATETAEVLEFALSPANSLLHRARRTIAENYQKPMTVRPPTVEKTPWLLDRSVRAWRTADMDGLVALLKWDAIIAMPPSSSWYRGRKAIAAFSTMSFFGIGGMFPGKAKGRWRLLPTPANAAPAFAIYQCDEENRYRAFGLQVLILQRGRISYIVNFIDLKLPIQFGFLAVLK